MMQLWEGNSKENVLQMDIQKIICKGKNTIFAKKTEIRKWACIMNAIIENHENMDFSKIAD